MQRYDLKENDSAENFMEMFLFFFVVAFYCTTRGTSIRCFVSAFTDTIHFNKTNLTKIMQNKSLALISLW